MPGFLHGFSGSERRSSYLHGGKHYHTESSQSKKQQFFCVWVIRLSHKEILLESYALLIFILKCISTMVLCLFVNFCIFLSTCMFSAYTLCCDSFLFRPTLPDLHLHLCSSIVRLDSIKSSFLAPQRQRDHSLHPLLWSVVCIFFLFFSYIVW